MCRLASDINGLRIVIYLLLLEAPGLLSLNLVNLGADAGLPGSCCKDLLMFHAHEATVDSCLLSYGVKKEEMVYNQYDK